MIIPLESGFSFIKFKVVLSSRLFTFRLRWMTAYQFYSVDVIEGTDDVVLGRGLHPDTDLFEGLNLNVGRLYLDGDAATVDNLGSSNVLRYEEQ